MRLSILLLFFVIGLSSCMDNETSVITDHYFDLKNRESKVEDFSGMRMGKSYLSVYSQIYQSSNYDKYNLTITVSMRNADAVNKNYLLKADYYDASGKLINEYIKQPIYMSPMETIEIVINENDKSGGTGGNFIFQWATKGSTDPLFEAIMISTKSQQGISFVTKGITIY